jgi:hypothetical protein
VTRAGCIIGLGADLKVVFFPRYFVDFVVFEKTSFVLGFGDFVTVERDDFSLRKF